MRYISISALLEGMVLGKPIYGGNLGVLLGEGLTLSSYHIQRINNLGYAGVYILDDISQGITARDMLPTELRLNVIKSAKEMTRQAGIGKSMKKGAKTSRQQQERIVMPVISAMIENPRRLVDLIDLKPEEDYLYYHAANVMILSILIGVELGLSGVQLFELGMSALLYDVGNIFIPKAILEKPGKLTPDEYEIIRSHTEKGFEYLRDNFEISIEGCMGALHHHESYDGSGYPTGLKRDKISIYGRIIAITDVYDALTSRRPFRDMLYPDAAIEYLNSKSDIMFDPKILEVFQRLVPLYPTGVCVELDSGVRGVVAQNYPGYPDRPKIRLLNSKSEAYVDLRGDQTFRDCSVARIL